ncbi:MAG: aldo/keto reductase [Planctomycetota bacterium]
MQMSSIPNTDLSVSKLCFGCWGIISDAHWGERESEDSVRAMQAAIDTGVNFFDTAPMYGQGASEILLGEFLEDRGLRGDTIIATKIRPDRMRPEQVIQECEESLERLQTDYIDLYQTHWTDREVPLEDTWEAMCRLQEQGKVRFVAGCNMGVDDLNSVGAQKLPVSNQLPFNLLWRAIEFDILPRCIQDEIGVLVYSPLLHGILNGSVESADDVPEGRARTRHFSSQRKQTRHGEKGCEELTFATLKSLKHFANSAGQELSSLALQWILHQPNVSSVIVGARNADQVEANVLACDANLSEDLVAAMSELTDKLKSALGDNPDMWDGSGNGRYR